MKKLIVAILAFLYIGTSTGATIHMHYCMGKLVNWSLWHDKDHNNQCGKCGMSKSNKAADGCCKDEHKLVKLEKDQLARENVVPFTPVVAAVVPPVFAALQNVPLNAVTVAYPVSHAPPGYNGQYIYLLHCTFLI